MLATGDAESAMRLYEQHQSAVALLLTDVVTPNMNGLELADRVLQLEPRMRILFMSATEGVSRGFGCIGKPFTRAQLISRVGAGLASEAEMKALRESPPN